MPAPAVSLEAILIGVQRLVHVAYCDAEGRSRWVRRAVVRAALDGGGSWELPVAFREALADPQDAWSSIKGAILRKPPERPVEELEVELVGLSAESGKQAAMFEGKGKLWRQVQEAVRQLGTQREASSVGKVVALDPRSRIPERRLGLAEIESDVCVMDMSRKIRKQIYIDREQEDLLKRRAEALGISEAEIIRRKLNEPERPG